MDMPTDPCDDIVIGQELDEAITTEELENGLDELDQQHVDHHEDGTTLERTSIYLLVFEDMMNIVYETEPHLLSDEEWDIITAFSRFNYKARYLISRLALRKMGQWYPMTKLEKLKKEIGEALPDAIDEACVPINFLLDRGISDQNKENVRTPRSVKEEQEIIDLTLDSEGEDDFLSSNLDHTTVTPQIMSSSSLSDSPRSTPEVAKPNLSFFCQDESCMTTDELLSCLSVDQLKGLTKDMKVQITNQTKSEIISMLLNHASRQYTLGFATEMKGKQQRGNDRWRQTTLGFPVANSKSSKCLRQSTLGFQGIRKPSMRSQEQTMRSLVLKRLVKCVRLNPDFYRLLVRLHVIFFRSTELPTSLCLPALLTAFKKRSYSKYPYQRSSNIWCSREEIIKYVEALEIDANLDYSLDQYGTRPSKILKSDLPTTPSTILAKGGGKETPLRKPLATSSSADPTHLNNEQEDSDEAEDAKGTPREQKARKVKQFFQEVIYPTWKVFCFSKDMHMSTEAKRPGLERFEPGYVFTRMVHKSAQCLGTLKEYTLEREVLEALLAQKHWLRGKRARWHERLSIILYSYLSPDDTGKRRKNIIEQAMVNVITALEDEETGLVHRPGLIRRLNRLETRLNIPESQRSVCEGQLLKPPQVHIEAVRIWESALLDSNGEVGGKGKENRMSTTPIRNTSIRTFYTPRSEQSTRMDQGQEPQTPGSGITPHKQLVGGKSEMKWAGKSIWLGNDGQEVNVETRALQYYERLGFKGFHSETRVLTTIFALLFWDIIFANIPGAFETPYQTAPLDMADETFYHARKDSINVRLKEIRGGWTKTILDQNDQKYREKQTWCIGVRWDICESADLVEIVECLGGDALAHICRLFCEDYGGRSSGVPDLVVWNAEEKKCKFVEVKGPGDTEQENQKLWMNSLLEAGIAVEVCRVWEAGKRPPTKKGKAQKKSGVSTLKVKRSTKRKVNTPSTSTKGKHQAIQIIDVDADDCLIMVSDADEAKGDHIRRSGKKRQHQAKSDDEDVLPVFGPSTSSPQNFQPDQIGVSLSDTPFKRTKL